MSIKRDLVRNAPTLFHAVALVETTKEETVRSFRKMALATPPNLYTATSDLVYTALSGQGYDWALRQIPTIKKEKQRDIAERVFPLLKDYIQSTRTDWIRPLDVEYFQVAADLQIPIRVRGLLSVGSELVVLGTHLWKRRLREEQFRAAITILHKRIYAREELRSARLNLLDISASPLHGDREFRNLGWDAIALMSDEELKAFTDRLYEGWKEYNLNPATKPKPNKRPSDQPDMFDNPGS